jgi:hypothetical protein
VKAKLLGYDGKSTAYISTEKPVEDDVGRNGEAIPIIHMKKKHHFQEQIEIDDLPKDTIILLL